MQYDTILVQKTYWLISSVKPISERINLSKWLMSVSISEGYRMNQIARITHIAQFSVDENAYIGDRVNFLAGANVDWIWVELKDE